MQVKYQCYLNIFLVLPWLLQDTIILHIYFLGNCCIRETNYIFKFSDTGGSAQ